MRVLIAWWDLERSSQTIDGLRHYLRDESVGVFEKVQGLRFKAWISDADANRWGAVLVWESAQAAVQPLPGRAAELIGYPPTNSWSFDVEATVEGQYAVEALAGRGLAFG